MIVIVVVVIIIIQKIIHKINMTGVNISMLYYLRLKPTLVPD